MTEARVRQCPKCNAKFIKTKGCNRIVCRCEAVICYVCRQIISGKVESWHFCSCEQKLMSYGTCPNCHHCYLFSRIGTVREDAKLVQLAKKKAEQVYKVTHPEIAKKNIVIGPKWTKPPKKKRKIVANDIPQYHPSSNFMVRSVLKQNSQQCINTNGIGNVDNENNNSESYNDDNDNNANDNDSDNNEDDSDNDNNNDNDYIHFFY
jgi:hypothetical protein